MFSIKNTLLLVLLTSLSSLYAQPSQWGPTASYSTGALVIVGTSTYIATQSVPQGTSPPDTLYWTDLALAAAEMEIPVEDVPTETPADILASLPMQTQIALSNDSVAGDTVSLTIDSETFTYVVVTGDTNASIISALIDKAKVKFPNLSVQDQRDGYATIVTLTAEIKSTNSDVDTKETQVTPPTSGSTTGGGPVFTGISSRAYVDDAPMVGSVIITGTEPKNVMIRAKGPSMASALPNKKLLANPKITILQKINDVWSIKETSLDYGDHSSSSVYSSLSTGNTLEPMIVTSLIPGTYSMRVEDESGGSGNANLEIYEIEDDTSSSVFYGVSSRAYVDDAPMVGSVIITGTESKNVMIRAKGPSMATALPNKKLLANPKITVLQKVNGVWSTLITSLDYGDHSSSSSYSSLSTGNDLEPMIVVSLDPGTYSMRVEDESGGTGNANLEIYEVK